MKAEAKRVDSRARGRDATVASQEVGSSRVRRWLKWLRWGAVLLSLASVLLLVRALPFEQISASLKGWIEGLGVWGPVALAAIYVVATVLFVPGTLLTLVAGAMFGLAVGMVTVSVGSTLGAGLAFLIARYGAREKVARMAQGNRHFSAIDHAIEEGGWKIVALLRLSPAVPFNLQNYLYGLTPVRFWPYLLTSWVAMLPGTFLYVYIGHVTGAAMAGNRERSPLEWGMLVIGLLATVAVTVYVTRLARRKLREQVEAPESDIVESESTEPQPIKTAVLALAACALFAISLYANQNREVIRRSIVSLLDRPQ